MSNYYENDYARNKDDESIVYKTVTGELIEITKEAFLKENENLTEEDFQQLKEYSDGMYHEESKGERNHRRAVKGSQNLENCVAGTHEEEMIVQEEKDRIIKFVKNLIDSSKMTETQKRRMMSYYGFGKNLREIAQEENVSHVAIYKSLQLAKKKLKK